MLTHPSTTGRLAAAASLAALSLLVMRCGSAAPTMPTPPVSPQPPPPANTPPAIQSLSASSPRVEADEEIEVTAVVVDAETQADQLTYTWSAAPANGTFVGSGQQVRW